MYTCPKGDSVQASINHHFPQTKSMPYREIYSYCCNCAFWPTYMYKHYDSLFVKLVDIGDTTLSLPDASISNLSLVNLCSLDFKVNEVWFIVLGSARQHSWAAWDGSQVWRGARQSAESTPQTSETNSNDVVTRQQWGHTGSSEWVRLIAELLRMSDMRIVYRILWQRWERKFGASTGQVVAAHRLRWSRRRWRRGRRWRWLWWRGQYWHTWNWSVTPPW